MPNLTLKLRTGIGPLLREDNTYTKSSKEMAQLLSDQYKLNVFSVLQESNRSIPLWNKR